jgi:dihydrofolate reductase
VKLTTNTQVSIDGVMQANGGRHEILDPGMERGGWARPLFDSEAMAFVDEFYQRADAFLFGRRTYDLFAGYWGVGDDLENPIVGALNTKPKYVASNTLTEADWADTTVLSGDVAVAIRELKAKPGGELQVHGSGLLTRWLLENDLVDEMNLLVCPVIVGQDMRLFPDSGRAVRDSGLLDEFVARAGADPDTMTLHELPYREAKRYLAEHAPGVDGDATAASDAPPPPFVYAKSDFFRQLLPESTIRALVEHFLRQPGGRSGARTDFTPWGGAYNRIDASATAFPHRQESLPAETRRSSFRRTQLTPTETAAAAGSGVPGNGCAPPRRAASFRTSPTLISLNRRAPTTGPTPNASSTSRRGTTPATSFDSTSHCEPRRSWLAASSAKGSGLGRLVASCSS